MEMKNYMLVVTDIKKKAPDSIKSGAFLAVWADVVTFAMEYCFRNRYNQNGFESDSGKERSYGIETGHAAAIFCDRGRHAE